MDWSISVLPLSNDTSSKIKSSSLALSSNSATTTHWLQATSTISSSLSNDCICEAIDWLICVFDSGTIGQTGWLVVVEGGVVITGDCGVDDVGVDNGAWIYWLSCQSINTKISVVNSLNTVVVSAEVILFCIRVALEVSVGWVYWVDRFCIYVRMSVSSEFVSAADAIQDWKNNIHDAIQKIHQYLNAYFITDIL